jgi:hypothetical protein
MRSRRVTFAALFLLALAEAAPAAADEIPVFARRYRVSCVLCHNPAPTLTEFGERFAANGFRMAAGETPGDTLATGDADLTLLQGLPLAARLDAYAQAFTNGRAVTDFQAPYSLKVFSSGALSGSIAWYFYAFLAERGEVGGVEDAFLHFNDLGGAPVDLVVGQFQASDPMFKRELRLEFEDYAVYRARLGGSRVDLTYDRGAMGSLDAAGFTVTAEILNGNGRGAAGDDRRFDDGPGKNVALHVTRDLVPGVRLGALGYYGRATSEGVRNETVMLGADATLARGPLELNVQYLHREDDRPLFLAADPGATLDGGFAELLVRPVPRWYGFALYNLVRSDQPVLDVRLGGTAGRRYETISAGVGHLLRRNVRVSAEGMYDVEAGGTRWTLGVVSAF